MCSVLKIVNLDQQCKRAMNEALGSVFGNAVTPAPPCGDQRLLKGFLKMTV